MAQAIPTILTSAANASITNPYLLIFAYIAIAYLSNTLLEEEEEGEDPTSMVRSGIHPKSIVYGTYEISGPILYAGGFAGDIRAGLSLIVALTGHPIDGFEAIKLGDKRINAEKVYGPTASSSYAFKPHHPDYYADTRIFMVDGQDAEDGWALGLKTAIGHKWAGGLVAEPATVYTEADVSVSPNKLNDIAYVGVLLKKSENWPNIPDISARIRGKLVRSAQDMYSKDLLAQDPLSSLKVFSNDWADCILDYLMDPVLGLGTPLAELDLQSFSDASLYCSQQIIPPNFVGAGARFTVGGVLSTGDTPVSNLEKLLSAAHGSLIYSGGKYYLYPAQYRTPLLSDDLILTEDDILDKLTIGTGASRGDRFSAVKGTYKRLPRQASQVITEEEVQGVVTTEFPEVANTAYRDADSGWDDYTLTELNGYTYKDIKLPMTTSSIQAQRIAAIILNKARQGITVSCEVGRKALNYRVGDNIKVNLGNLGIGVETNPGFVSATFGTPVISAGSITSVPVLDGGAGYLHPPTITQDLGVNALLYATLQQGSISSIIVVEGGSGYSTSTLVQAETPVGKKNSWVDKVFTVDSWSTSNSGAIELVLKEDSVASYSEPTDMVEEDDAPDIQVRRGHDDYTPTNLRITTSPSSTSLGNTVSTTDILAEWDPGLKPSSVSHYEVQMGKGSAIKVFLDTLSVGATVVDSTQPGGYSAPVTFVTTTSIAAPNAYSQSNASGALGTFNFNSNTNTAALPEYRDWQGNFQDFGEETIL